MFLYRISCRNDVQLYAITHTTIFGLVRQSHKDPKSSCVFFFVCLFIFFFLSWKIELNYANSVYLLRLTSQVLLSGEKQTRFAFIGINSNFRKETKCINSRSGVYFGTDRLAVYKY